MVDNILKYGSSNLIILYHYIYSRLSGTMKIIIWNFMRLIKNVRSGSQIDE